MVQDCVARTASNWRQTMFSVSLLTVACLTGAVDPPQVAGGCDCGTAAKPSGVIYYESGPPKGTFRYRLRQWLGLSPQVSSYPMAPAYQPLPTTAAVPVVKTAPPPQATTGTTQ